MTDWEQTPNGEIGEPGVGFSKGFWRNAMLAAVASWLVFGMAAFTAVRFIHWIFRG